MGCNHHDQDVEELEPARIIIYNEAVICMARYNKDTAGNCHIARRYHYMWDKEQHYKNIHLNGLVNYMSNFFKIKIVIGVIYPIFFKQE